MLKLTRWIVLPNFIFVALPVPKILGVALKFWESRDQGHSLLSETIIKGICLAYHCEYAYQILNS